MDGTKEKMWQALEFIYFLAIILTGLSGNPVEVFFPSGAPLWQKGLTCIMKNPGGPQLSRQIAKPGDKKIPAVAKYNLVRPMESTEIRDTTLAVFIDFENLAQGFPRNKNFDMNIVLERLVEKGKVVVKKAYADWSRFNKYKHELHELAIELIEIPKRSQTGKNSADIRLCVDAMDLCYQKIHVSTFVIVSGDSDFSPLVSKLKENGKMVIGLGMKASTSDLLRDNCDEFVYYEDLERSIGTPPNLPKGISKEKRQAFDLLLQSVSALMRENKEIIYSSMVKDTMKRKKPSFDESYCGYRSFSDLLLDAEKKGLLSLRTDARSGTYTVAGFGS